MTPHDSATADEIRLFTVHGLRKYIDTREARRLLAVAAEADRPVRLFC